MHLIAYRASQPDNLYRLCSIGGHTADDLHRALDFIFAAPHKAIAIILDIQNGLSLFPKEAISVFARRASEHGIANCELAIIAPPEEHKEIEARYSHYPELTKQYVDINLQIFTNEADASLWVVNNLENKS